MHPHSGSRPGRSVTLPAASSLLLTAILVVGGLFAPTAATGGASAVAVAQAGPTVLARDGAGVLWSYPGDGAGGWLARVQVGSGWNAMTAIFADSGSKSTAGTLARFQSRCFYPDGRVLGDFSSLEETWGSTNYLRIDHCVTRYGGPPPFTLTENEAAIAEIASSQLTDPGEPEQIFLNVFAACTRIGSEDGPYGFSSIPVPVLEAALSLCPEAPQANIIRDRIGG